MKLNYITREKKEEEVKEGKGRERKHQRTHGEGSVSGKGGGA